MYRGWQSQNDNPNTIQSYVERILKDIINHQEFKFIAAGRTDSGVHSHSQVLRVDLPIETDPLKLQRGMNTKLPLDIRVIFCEKTSPSFNPNKDSIYKEYHYYFSTQECRNAILGEMIYYHPEKINIESMKIATELFIGLHDFKNYTAKIKTPNTKRNVIHCSIEQTTFDPFQDEIYYLKIQASGFLTYMVRYIMGSLIDIGTSKLSLDQIKESLDGVDSPHIKCKAPAHGLHLMDIEYP